MWSLCKARWNYWGTFLRHLHHLFNWGVSSHCTWQWLENIKIVKKKRIQVPFNPNICYFNLGARARYYSDNTMQLHKTKGGGRLHKDLSASFWFFIWSVEWKIGSMYYKKKCSFQTSRNCTIELDVYNKTNTVICDLSYIFRLWIKERRIRLSNRARL